MTADQYRAALSQLGLTQLKAGALLGYGLRASNAYAAGDLKVPKSVAINLMALIAKKITRKWIDEITMEYLK